MPSPVLIIESHLGSTDCSGCRFFRRSCYIFAQRFRQPEDSGIRKFVSLPLKVAELPTVDAAKTALERINVARQQRKGIVNLKDLERCRA